MKVLAGSKEQKLRALGFERLSTYGLMKNQSQKETMQLIEYLISNGYLLTVNGEYPILKVTERGIQVLKGQEAVYRKEPKKSSSCRMKRPIHYLKCCGNFERI